MAYTQNLLMELSYLTKGMHGRVDKLAARMYYLLAGNVQVDRLLHIVTLIDM